MHRFWTIPELVAQMLDYLENWDRCRVVQVCDTLWAPAARQIWNEVPRLSDLLRLFPEEHQVVYRLSASTESVALPGSGCLWSKEWERFRLYSPFVRALHLTIDDFNYKTLLRLHSYSKGVPLLPNVQTINVQTHLATLIPGPTAAECGAILDLLLTPSLQNVKCAYSHLPVICANDMSVNTCKRLLEAPNLDNFQLTCKPMTDRAQQSMCDFIRSTRLHTIALDATTLPHDVLLSASQIPELTKASLGNFQDTSPATLSRNIFISRSELNVTGTISGLNMALSAIEAPKLQRLFLKFEDQTSTMWPPEPAPLGTIDGCQRFSTLRELRLDYFSPILGPTASILSLKELISLHIKFAHLSLIWADTTPTRPSDMIQLIARSFPKLEDVVIKNDVAVSEDTNPSLVDLECFAEYCSRLKRLTLSVASIGAEVPYRRLTPHPNLEEVDLLESMIYERVETVAKIVHKLWPNLRRGITTLEREGSWRAQPWIRIWQQVSRMQLENSSSQDAVQ